MKSTIVIAAVLVARWRWLRVVARGTMQTAMTENAISLEGGASS